MPADVQDPHAPTQSSPEPAALPLRAHTIFGVCEALGEDFGFNPLLLRVPFAASVLISPLYAVLAYLALGLVVLGSRLLFPAARSVARAAGAGQIDSDAANGEAETRLAA